MYSPVAVFAVLVMLRPVPCFVPAELCCTHPLHTAATFTAYHAVIYDTSVSNDLIASIDFGGAKAVVAGTFTIQWDAAGIITLA